MRSRGASLGTAFGLFRFRRMRTAAVKRHARTGAELLREGVLLLVATWAAARMLSAHGLGSARGGDHDLRPEAFDRREPGRGRAATAPHRIPPRGWLDIAWRVFRTFNADRLMFVAGGVTFFTLLAVFPAVGAFVSLYGLIADPETAREPLRYFYGVVPRGVLDFLGDQMARVAAHRSDTLSAAFFGSLLLSLWSTNASVKSLIYGLNVAYHETEKRNYFRYSGVTMVFTLCGLAFVLIASSLVVVAPLAASWLGWEYTLKGLAPLRWPLLVVLYVVTLSLLYRYGPCRQRARWRWLTPGGLIAAALSLAVSWLFSWYLSNIADYDAAYGPLGALMGFMIWTWWSTTVVLLGAATNAEIEHQTAWDTTTGAPLPLGRRGAVVADTVGPRRGAKGADRYTVEYARELARKLAARKGKKPDA
jgi:membrane protein